MKFTFSCHAVMHKGREKGGTPSDCVLGLRRTQGFWGWGLQAHLDLAPELGGGDGLEVGGVGAGDGDAVTLEEALRAVEALRGQLVVPEGAQQLADQDNLPARAPASCACPPPPPSPDPPTCMHPVNIQGHVNLVLPPALHDIK